jgi:3-isopropylmalate/(R)-2-methylmalate dehydratase small subunit
MEKFTPFESQFVTLPIDNIDTDQIIPARFLKTISKAGLGDQLFYDWRYDSTGAPRPDFVLNKPESKARRILLGGDNFGCGSSREHAPWALTQYGFRAVISTSAGAGGGAARRACVAVREPRGDAGAGSGRPGADPTRWPPR